MGCDADKGSFASLKGYDVLEVHGESPRETKFEFPSTSNIKCEPALLRNIRRLVQPKINLTIQLSIILLNHKLL
jgi:hypothetical protein